MTSTVQLLFLAKQKENHVTIEVPWFQLGWSWFCTHSIWCNAILLLLEKTSIINTPMSLDCWWEVLYRVKGIPVSHYCPKSGVGLRRYKELEVNRTRRADLNCTKEYSIPYDIKEKKTNHLEMVGNWLAGKILLGDWLGSSRKAMTSCFHISCSMYIYNIIIAIIPSYPSPHSPFPLPFPGIVISFYLNTWVYIIFSFSSFPHLSRREESDWKERCYAILLKEQ